MYIILTSSFIAHVTLFYLLPIILVSQAIFPSPFALHRLSCAKFLDSLVSFTFYFFLGLSNDSFYSVAVCSRIGLFV
jgi:hypothetical protein